MALVNVVTHEGMMIGWAASAGEGGGLTLELAYAFKAHAGAIQCALASGSTVLCGCADGAIEVFNTKSRSSVGQLLEHKAGVTALAAHGGHVMSGDAAGALVVWRCTDWTPLTKLKGHTAAISSIAVHPSGRVALSVGEDKCLYLWDLVKGRVAHCTPLPAPPRHVRWVRGGSAYEVVFDEEVVTTDAGSGKQVAAVSFKGSRLRCSAHGAGKEGTLLAGLEGGSIHVVREEGRAVHARVDAHEKRVRALAAFSVPSTVAGAGAGAWVASAGGDGVVKVWSQGSLLAGGGAGGSSLGPHPAATLTAAKGFRITDMAVVQSSGGGARREGGGQERAQSSSAAPTTAGSAASTAPPASAEREALLVGHPGRVERAVEGETRAGKRKEEGHSKRGAPRGGEGERPGTASTHGAGGHARGEGRGSAVQIKLKKRRVE